jgi:predicted ATPase
MGNVRENFFAVTGGPGSGKSTLIDSLKNKGIACVPEVGRRIIQCQVPIDGKALPWKTPALYAEMEFSVSLLNYFDADETRLTVFDRGILDPAGFLSLNGLPVPAHFETAFETIRYNHLVFVAPPWAEIYARDKERKQEFAEAIGTYDAMVQLYGKAGYRLITLPLADVEARTVFVLDRIAAACK